MAVPTTNAAFYADFSRLAELKRQSKTQGDDALHSAAQQFEGLFLNMVLKSMREASSGDSLTGSETTKLYEGMFDQQLSVQLSQGKGIGLADMLVEQLKRQGLVRDAAQATGASTSAGPAAAAPASGAANSTATSSRAQFVKQMMPYAQQVAQKLGVDANTLIAHAALETGWGQSLPTGVAGSSNNLFGIKAGNGWRGATTASPTTEYENGVATARTERFRAYSSPEDCFKDYVALLGNPRYAAACNSGGDVAQFATALQQAGYATDPQYAIKLQAVASSVSKLAEQT